MSMTFRPEAWRASQTLSRRNSTHRGNPALLLLLDCNLHVFIILRSDLIILCQIAIYLTSFEKASVFYCTGSSGICDNSTRTSPWHNRGAHQHPSLKPCNDLTCFISPGCLTIHSLYLLMTSSLVPSGPKANGLPQIDHTLVFGQKPLPM